MAGVIDEMVARETYIEAYQYIIASDKKLLTETVTDKTASIKEHVISSALSQSETMLAAGQYIDAVELLKPLASIDNKLFQAYRKCQRQFYSDLVDRAKPNVTVEYDDMEDQYAVVPKGCEPFYVNIDYSRNIDCKLIVKSGRPLFNLCLGFEQSDWIFMDEIIFDCDGEKFTWNVDYFDRGTDIHGGEIAEWYAVLHNPKASGSADKIKNLAPLVEAMTHAETVKVRFNGEGHKDVVIPSKHIAQIETIWSLYQALDFYAPLFDQLK